MDDLYGVVGSAAALAPLLVLLTEQLKAALPRVLTSARVPLVTLVLGPALMAGAWAAGFVPEAMTWRMALALGLEAALMANGWYSGFKAIVSRTAPAPLPGKGRGGDGVQR